MAKSPAKKTAQKTAAKTSRVAKEDNGRKPNPQRAALHEKLIALLSKPNGATLSDTVAAGFAYPAVAALRIAERRGFKTSIVKKVGESARYFAKAPAKTAS